MFGVILIHTNSDTMRQWLWFDTFDNVGWFATDYAVLHAFISVTMIFIIRIGLDLFRLRFVEKTLFNILDKNLFVK